MSASSFSNPPQREQVIASGGSDFMSGGGGDDTFFARDGTIDTLIGGAGRTDRAQTDEGDLVSAIEELLA